ncbi:MAG: VOC family protein, partial [Bryobacteraceae bacterium]
MAAQVKKIPAGYHAITPYLVVNDATRAIDFYKQAFGAKELTRMGAPGGKIGHAELK